MNDEKESKRAYDRIRYKKNLEKRKAYRIVNAEKAKAYAKEYYSKNKEKAKLYKRRNKEKIRTQKKSLHKRNTAKNSLYSLTLNLRSRTYLAFTNLGYTKRAKTNDILGADWLTVKSHLESLFYGDMSWDNYGDWHVDHIYPIAIAESESHLMGLCNYQNLQPLWAVDNLEKSDKLPENWVE